ncbi:MAG: hypothetical protein PHG63_04000 [Candidatus Dojkabacteria bacterium]|nr:hypothetical protein [Candidatus Dojkabacteria bacterium]
MEILHWFSIAVEAVIALMGISLALTRKRVYGWGFFVTFSLYVFYDLAKHYELDISSDLLYVVFFVATVSALWAVWQLLKEK